MESFLNEKYLMHTLYAKISECEVKIESVLAQIFNFSKICNLKVVLFMNVICFKNTNGKYIFLNSFF